MRVITAAQIADANLPLGPVYDLVLAGFGMVGRGEVECPPKLGIHPRSDASTHVMSAYLPIQDLAGTKLVSVYPGNPSRGLAAINGMIVMQDPDTGIPTSLLDAAWVTSVRTAMVSMVDVQYLANPAPTFGIVGATGVTGRAHIAAIATVFPGSRIRVGSRSSARLDALLRDFAACPCELVPTNSDEIIVRNSDVVIVSIVQQAEPTLWSQWLHPGHNILNVHTLAWPRDILSSVDLVSCDDRRPITNPDFGLIDVYPDLDPDIELGQVVIGQSKGRSAMEQIVFSYNYGLAVFDVLVADYVLRSL